MHKFFSTGIIVLLICGHGFGAEPLFHPRLKTGDTSLVLSGVGSLSRWFIKGCDIALYAEDDAKKSQILEDIPKCLEFYYVRTIKAEQFAVAAWDTLEKNWDHETLQVEKDAIDKMHSFYREVSKGDRYKLLYVPGEGTTLFLNGQELGRIADIEFSRVYFSIWLGANPIDIATRDRMMQGLK